MVLRATQAYPSRSPLPRLRLIGLAGTPLYQGPLVLPGRLSMFCAREGGIEGGFNSSR